MFLRYFGLVLVYTELPLIGRKSAQLLFAEENSNEEVFNKSKGDNNG